MSYFHCQCPSSQHDDFWRYATGDEVRNTFRENTEELAWLAMFLTGNAQLAKVCVVDACAVATTSSDVCAQWLERWTRFCTINSAVEMQKPRISLLASAYESVPCRDCAHTPLTPLVVELLFEEPQEIGCHLDVLSRAAVVLIGIERYSATEAARILGVSRTAVEAAYFTALDILDILNCERFMDSGGEAHACC